MLKGIDPILGPELLAAKELIDQCLAQRERERRDKIRNEAQWEASQEARAAAHRREVVEHWGAIASRAEARAELQVHADRMARLNRILDLAVDSRDDDLASHCRRVIQREVVRNARAMAKIETEVAR